MANEGKIVVHESKDKEVLTSTRKQVFTRKSIVENVNPYLLQKMIEVTQDDNESSDEE